MSRYNPTGNTARFCPDCGMKRKRIGDMAEVLRRRRFRRRAAKWTCLFLSFLVLVAWAASMFVWVSWVDDPEDPTWRCLIAEGQMSWGRVDAYSILIRTGQKPSSWRIQTVRNPLYIPREILHKGDFSLLIRTFGLRLPQIESSGHPTCIPFWLVFVVAVCTTIVFFRLDRPAKPGHCPTCHYNLTGNTSGICPECGTQTTANPNLEGSIKA